MKNRLGILSYYFLIFLNSWFSMSSAGAVELNVQPRVNTGLLYYEFEQDAVFTFFISDNDAHVFGPNSKLSVSDTMPFLGIGVTVFANRFSFDFYAQKAISGEDTIEQQQGTFSSTTLAYAEGAREWDRKEYSVSVGFAVTDHTAVFAGYRQSNSDFDQITIGHVVGNPTPFEPVKSRLKYKQDGPFIGITNKLIVNNGGFFDGAIGLSYGLAFIDGDLVSTTGKHSKGDTIGVMTGISWQSSITDRLGYTLALDHYRYDFNADNSGILQGIEDSNVFYSADFSEMLIKTSVGINYLF